MIKFYILTLKWPDLVLRRKIQASVYYKKSELSIGKARVEFAQPSVPYPRSLSVVLSGFCLGVAANPFASLLLRHRRPQIKNTTVL